jgi:hypothetical protein
MKLNAAQAALVAKWEAEAERKHLLEALVQHCRVFHFCGSQQQPRLPVAPERERLLTWFASLSVQARASAITTDEAEWVVLVLRMLEERGEEGGNFLVLHNNIGSAPRRQRGSNSAKERLLLAEMDPLTNFRLTKTKRAKNGDTLSSEQQLHTFSTLPQ